MTRPKFAQVRRATLAAPILAGALQGCGSTPACDPPRQEVSFDLATVPRADGGIECTSACRDLARSVDAGVPLADVESCAESLGAADEPVLVCRYYQYLCD